MLHQSNVPTGPASTRKGQFSLTSQYPKNQFGPTIWSINTIVQDFWIIPVLTSIPLLSFQTSEGVGFSSLGLFVLHSPGLRIILLDIGPAPPIGTWGKDYLRTVLDMVWLLPKQTDIMSKTWLADLFPCCFPSLLWPQTTWVLQRCQTRNGPN